MPAKGQQRYSVELQYPSFKPESALYHAHAVGNAIVWQAYVYALSRQDAVERVLPKLTEMKDQFAGKVLSVWVGRYDSPGRYPCRLMPIRLTIDTMTFR